MVRTPASNRLAQRYDAVRRAAARLDVLRPGAGDPWRDAAADALADVLALLAQAVQAIPADDEATPRTRPGTRTSARTRD